MKIRNGKFWSVIDEEWYYSNKNNRYYKMSIIHASCIGIKGKYSSDGNYSITENECFICRKKIPAYVKTIAMMEWV